MRRVWRYTEGRVAAATPEMQADEGDEVEGDIRRGAAAGALQAARRRRSTPG